MWGIIFSNNFSGRKRVKKQKTWREKKRSSKTKSEQAANEIFCKGDAEVNVLS